MEQPLYMSGIMASRYLISSSIVAWLDAHRPGDETVDTLTIELDRNASFGEPGSDHYREAKIGLKLRKRHDDEPRRAGHVLIHAVYDDGVGHVGGQAWQPTADILGDGKRCADGYPFPV